MDFSEALHHVKQGKAIFRKGWNGKDMYIKKVEIDYGVCEIEPFLAIRNTKGTLNAWVPSISDLFAEDWEIAW